MENLVVKGSMSLKSNVLLKGDIVLVDFGLTEGSEQGGVRPALVIQNNTGNRFSPTTIVVPITAQEIKAKLPTHLVIEAGKFQLEKTSVVLFEQPRTIDKKRILKLINSVSNYPDNVLHTFLSVINDKIRISLAL